MFRLPDELWNVKMDVRMVNSFLVFKRIIHKTMYEGYKCD